MPDAIANTSPPQYLHRMGLLELLHQQYGTVTIPAAVMQELESGAAQGADVPQVAVVPWIRLETITSISLCPIATSLGGGEREAIALALTKPEPLVILDDRSARREAQRLGIRVTGVLGILLKTKQRLDSGQPEPSLDELFDLRRVESPSDADREESIAAVAGAIDDFRCGDRGQPAGALTGELRTERNSHTKNL